MLSSRTPGDASFLTLEFSNPSQSLATIFTFFKKIFLVSLMFSRSVGSDPLRPHGLQRARLPCPSDF